jgi:hypothetical protein
MLESVEPAKSVISIGSMARAVMGRGNEMERRRRPDEASQTLMNSFIGYI